MNPSNELSNEKTDSNKVESKNVFKNLKSDFFLQKVFYNLLKKKSLDIIKYNNNISTASWNNFNVFNLIDNFTYILILVYSLVPFDMVSPAFLGLQPNGANFACNTVLDEGSPPTTFIVINFISSLPAPDAFLLVLLFLFLRYKIILNKLYII